MKGWRQVTSQDGAELVTLQQGHADRQCHQDPTGLIKVSKRRWHAELRLETIKVSTYNLYSIHIYIYIANYGHDTVCIYKIHNSSTKFLSRLNAWLLQMMHPHALFLSNHVGTDENPGNYPVYHIRKMKRMVYLRCSSTEKNRR